MLAELEEQTASFRGRWASHHERQKKRAKLAGDVQRAKADRLARVESPGPRCAQAELAASLGVTPDPVKGCGRCPGCIAGWVRHFENKERWHDQRERGQRERFARVKACGAHGGKVECQACGFGDGKGTGAKRFALGCEVTRLCRRCSVRKAIERRASFGAARAEAWERAHHAMLLSRYVPTRRLRLDRAPLAPERALRPGGERDFGRRYEDRYERTSAVPCSSCSGTGRRMIERGPRAGELARCYRCKASPDYRQAFRWMVCGGRWGEKMLTLTIPQREVCGVSARHTIKLRVQTLFEAWRKFSLKWSAHWRKVSEVLGRKEKPIVYRLFEWTPGRFDGAGNCHFHVYVLGPFLAVDMVRRWWEDALRQAGIHLPEGFYAAGVDVRALKTPGWIREVIKGGRVGPIQLSRLDVRAKAGGGVDAVRYADGWSLTDVWEKLGPDSTGALYCALEARRLAQGSAGFLVPRWEVACPDCGASGCLRFEKVDGAGRAWDEQAASPPSTGPPTAPDERPLESAPRRRGLAALEGLVRAAHEKLGTRPLDGAHPEAQR